MALITLARVKNIKRVRDVTITPESDAHLVLIAGPNMAGKTSLLDAIALVIGGAKLVPDDPVHHGAEAGFAHLEWDNGLTARRTIEKDGTSSLEVKDSTGKVKSPQALLTKLLGQRLIDPMELLRMPGVDRRQKLLEIIDVDKQIPKMDAHRQKVYDAREEVGRKVRDAKGERERLGTITDVPPPIDVAALSAELEAMKAKQDAAHAAELAHRSALAAHDAGDSAVRQAQTLVIDLEQKLAEARKTLERRTHELMPLKEKVAAAAANLEAATGEWSQLQPRRDEIAAELARANEHNKAATAAELMNKRRLEAMRTVEERQAQWDEQAEVLKKIDAKKLAFLAAAKLPVPGLGIADGDITFNGVPLSQASGAEKLRVALGISIAAQSEIKDILIRDAALLDDESMRLVEQVAAESGVRVWLERVGTRDPGAIIIRDGVVAEEA